MPATLKNISNGPVTLILDHAAFLNSKDGWRRSTAKFANMGEDGGRSTREVRRSYPGTLTIQPGAEVTDLHPAIAKCSQVPNLIAGKVLSLTLTDEPTKAPPPAAAESKPRSKPRLPEEEEKAR